MTSEIKRRFTDTEMQIARETDLPELLTHLGYQVKRIGRYHTAAEMDGPSSSTINWRCDLEKTIDFYVPCAGDGA